MPAIGAMQPGEPLSQITAAVEFLDDFDGVRPERPVSIPVRSFVLSLEFIPTVVDDLP